ncbi:dTDP-4-dehydrorhamnose 3,5-epimerase [Cupriavidus sp. D39]|uniref:dTDP-4-dehydrorhamnose 3,5-epimerase n=1 Tax=Cupriavidus sp. D39 TaxID=2997877 RepID=UPI002270246F|nr:dTDP-4-dehydrorhamnose 3,5-epimerase [Cupriavidus sp. D39]MCY0856227.1 dTDP-4-dehydrorhamnose 3,5-epimerase [Cupriavidus sp. D39]
MNLKATPTALPEVLILEPKVFGDERGFFFESFNARSFALATGYSCTFVQDNHSRSVKNVLRGLHYQLGSPQGKLIRVVSGDVFDVAVDLRRQSPRFGQWTSIQLSGESHRQLWIPPGFAHGFLVLSDEAEVLYKVSEYWNQADERTIAWNDPQLGIAWPLQGAVIQSDKDRRGVSLAEAELFP